MVYSIEALHHNPAIAMRARLGVDVGGPFTSGAR
jgi:hypothetical protein